MQRADEERIECRADVCHGKPVIRGTRVLVWVVAGAVNGGDSIEQVADDYQITIEDVRAAVDHFGRRYTANHA